MQNRVVAVLTPTYNREKELHNLYESLKSQTDKSFYLIIVDDGINDNTEESVSVCNSENNISFIYIKQKNSGKHIALNTGVAVITAPLTFIVDSDDVLTHDAIETIISDSAEVLTNDKLCGVGYLRGYSETQVIGDRYSANRFIGNFTEERFNKGIGGDKAEVWKTDDLKDIPFPEFEGERFFGESYVWCTLAKTKDILFINKIIYITEYLAGGLTKSGRRLRIKCPKGGMTNAELMMSSDFGLKSRIKGAMLLVTYAKFDKIGFLATLKKVKQKSLALICYLPGVALYIYWKKKFLNDGE